MSNFHIFYFIEIFIFVPFTENFPTITGWANLGKSEIFIFFYLSEFFIFQDGNCIFENSYLKIGKYNAFKAHQAISKFKIYIKKIQRLRNILVGNADNNLIPFTEKCGLIK